ncbi:GIY-YIG nuclease family protein [Candidatus Cloacimonadota bacterium]
MPIPDHLKEVVSNLPPAPGVYKFYDEKERLLYIGKSKNLKNRVRSYFRKQNDETQERTLMMIFHINEIKIERTETELEALILEDSMIKQHLPPYNVKQKKFREQVYISLTSDEYPVINVIPNDKVDLFSKIFGPFKDKYAAEFIISTILRVLRLRSCTDPTPKDKCMLAGIGKCLGPCQNNISSQEYNEVMRVAIELLEGKSKQFSEKIQKQIKNAVQCLDFEAAAQLRDINKFCLNFCVRQEFTLNILKKDTIIYGKKNTFLFWNCSLLKVYKNKMTIEQIRRYFKKTKNSGNKENIHHLIDRAYVVWVWVKQNQAKYEFLD